MILLDTDLFGLVVSGTKSYQFQGVFSLENEDSEETTTLIDKKVLFLNELFLFHVESWAEFLSSNCLSSSLILTLYFYVDRIMCS